MNIGCHKLRLHESCYSEPGISRIYNLGLEVGRLGFEGQWLKISKSRVSLLFLSLQSDELAGVSIFRFAAFSSQSFTLKKRKSEGKVAGAMFADTVFIGTRWP